MNRWAEIYQKNKKDLFFSLAATFFWGILAHAYVFFQNSFSHDSLTEFHGKIFGNIHKVELGRIFVPIYRGVLGTDVTLPWVIGFLSLAWISLAVLLIIRMFRVKSRVTTFLIAGVLSTNITVSAIAATFIHDLDSYMFSMLCAVGATYLWRAGSLRREIAGVLLVAVSLGIYQSFVFVTVTLVMFACLFDLLDGNSFRSVFLRGLKAAAMVLLGGLLYWAALKIVPPLYGTALESDGYNTMDQALKLTPGMIPRLVLKAYYDWFHRILNAYSSYPAILMRGIALILFGIVAAGILAGVCGKKLGWLEKLGCVGLAALLPLAMNFICVLTWDTSHDLMVYPICLFYVLALLFSERLLSHGMPGRMARLGIGQKSLVALLVLVLLWGNVKFANGMYMKKDMEQDARLSLMTRVLSSMEARDDYIPGETPVVFVQLPPVPDGGVPESQVYENIMGMKSRTNVIFGVKNLYRAYFDYVLEAQVNLAEDDDWYHAATSQLAIDMPCYPSKGYMEMQDGILIVKMGEIPLEELEWMRFMS